jgi:hypothetical protein
MEIRRAIMALRYSGRAFGCTRVAQARGPCNGERGGQFGVNRMRVLAVTVAQVVIEA